MRLLSIVIRWLLVCLGSCVSLRLTERNTFSIFYTHCSFIYKNPHILIRHRSTRRRAWRPSTRYMKSTARICSRIHARSHSSAHASLSLDVSLAATPIPHPSPISPYTTLVSQTKRVQLANLRCFERPQRVIFTLCPQKSVHLFIFWLNLSKINRF